MTFTSFMRIAYNQDFDLMHVSDVPLENDELLPFGVGNLRCKKRLNTMDFQITPNKSN